MNSTHEAGGDDHAEDRLAPQRQAAVGHACDDDCQECRRKQAEPVRRQGEDGQCGADRQEGYPVRPLCQSVALEVLRDDRDGENQQYGAGEEGKGAGPRTVRRTETQFEPAGHEVEAQQEEKRAAGGTPPSVRGDVPVASGHGFLLFGRCGRHRSTSLLERGKNPRP